MSLYFFLAVAAASPSPEQLGCFELFADVMQEIEQSSEDQVDALLAASRRELQGQGLAYKYSSFIADEKKHYLATYTTSIQDRDVVVQLVRSLFSPLDEKRRILRILAIHTALEAHGLRSILIGYAMPQDLLPVYQKDLDYWELGETDQVSFALVSEAVLFAENFKGRSGSTLSRWSEADLQRALKTLKRFESLLQTLHLASENLQYLVADHGEVIPVQLDRLQPGSEPVDLQSDRELLQALWQKAQGPRPLSASPKPTQQTLNLDQGLTKLATFIQNIRSSPLYALEPVLNQPVHLDAATAADINVSGGALGGNSQGVIALRVGDERHAVKIVAPGGVSARLFAKNGFLEAIQIQRVLGEMNYTPRLYEVYEGKRLDEVIRLINEASGFERVPFESSSFRYGLRMEEIPGAWVFDRAPYTPEFFRQWERPQLREAVIRIRELEGVLNRLYVVAGDAQVFISRHSRVILGDLDYYRIAATSEAHNDFTWLVFDLLNRWNTRSGEATEDLLSRKERAELLTLSP